MKTTYTYDHYYLHDEISEILNQYAKDYPQYVRLNSLTKTEEGRDMWMIEITDLSTGDFMDKPAYCLDANIHAGEVTGSMVAMYFLDTIMSNLDDLKIQKLLKEITIYVIPRISPDGSEIYLTTAEQLRSVNRPYPYGDTMPGLYPADLDGDGVIRKMLVKSPYGAWKKSEEDSRLMVKRRPDELDGEFYNVFQEGYIQDYDGLNIDAAPGKWGNDYNRNFPCNWKDESGQRGGGKYPLSNPETKALADFIQSHDNIGCILNMHTMGGQILYPPGIKSASEADKKDMERYRTIGKMGQEENGFVLLNIKDEYCTPGTAPLAGSFDDFNYFQMGLFNYTIECWDLAPRTGVEVSYPPKPIKSDEEQIDGYRKLIHWVDENLNGEGIMPWTKFDHPQLGEVEIGGIDYKKIIQNPPIKFLPQEIEKHTRFIHRQLNTLPRVIFTEVNSQRVSKDVVRIEAVVANKSYLPTYITQEALRVKTAKEIEVSLMGDEIEFVEGKPTQKIGQLEGFSGIDASVSMTGASSTILRPCAKRVSWVVKAKEGTKLQIIAESNKIGKIKTEIDC